jgi:hypothetical protein
MAVATVLGVAINISKYSALYGADGYEVNVFWSLFNFAVLVVACAVCVELPRRRVEERFRSSENATIRLNSGLLAPCVVRDLSLSGANLALDIGRLRSSDEGTIVFPDGTETPFKLVRNVPGGLAVRFERDPGARRQLIAKLFTGDYANDVAQIKIGSLLVALGKRLAA